MSTTQWLTVLGVLAGIAEYAMSKGFYPQVMSVVLAVSLGVSGVLSKGVESDNKPPSSK